MLILRMHLLPVLKPLNLILLRAGKRHPDAKGEWPERREQALVLGEARSVELGVERGFQGVDEEEGLSNYRKRILQHLYIHRLLRLRKRIVQLKIIDIVPIHIST